MSYEADGILAYGIDLGGFGHWKLHLPDDEDYELPWEAGDEGFTYDAQRFLAANGLTPDQVDVLWYGRDTSFEHNPFGTGYILAAAAHIAWLDQPAEVESDKLLPQLQWDMDLAKALDLLNMRPTKLPGWIVAVNIGT